MVSTRSKSVLAIATPNSKSSQSDKTPKTLLRGSTTIIPSSLKSVLLHDWWLVKADDGSDQGLAVGGFASREYGFDFPNSLCFLLPIPLSPISGPKSISKRHESTILEATDGIIVTISGFINRYRTSLNGFSPKVYNHFLLGFPFNWQDYVDSRSDVICAVKNIKTCDFHSDHQSTNRNRNVEPDLEDLSVTSLQDLILSTYGECTHCIFMKSSNLKGSSPVALVESGPNETPKRRENVYSCQDHKRPLPDEGMNDFSKDHLVTVQEAKSKMSEDYQVSSVSTRMTGRKGKKALLSDSQKKQCKINNSPCGNFGMRTGQGDKSSSKFASPTDTSIKSDVKVDGITAKSEGRRSSLRLRNRKQNQ